jgi:DNA-binding transcriptional LysR family regulator
LTTTPASKRARAASRSRAPSPATAIAPAPARARANAPARLRSSLDGARAPAAPDASALEFFAHVAGAGSFAEAARRLGTSRAAISRRVAHLEAQLGSALFARSTRAFGLTEAGRRLHGRARAVAEAAEAARRSLRERSAGDGSADAEGLSGNLRITSVPMFGQAVLGPLLARFQAQHPRLRIELRFTPRRVDLVREDVDLAFRLTERPPEDCVAQPVLPFVVRAYAAPSDAWPLRAPTALAQERCLLFGPPQDEVSLRWLSEGAPRRVSVTLAPAIVADDLGSLLAVARAGGGIVFAPDFCVLEDLERGTLVCALPGWRLPVPEGEVVQAITLPAALAPASARALVRFMREALGSTLGR